MFDLDETDRVTPCPVCGTPMKCSNDTLEGVTCESEEVCPNSCYTYLFAYGVSHWFIGDKEWHEHYTDSLKKVDKQQVERSAEVKRLRACRRLGVRHDIPDEILKDLCEEQGIER